MKEQYGIGLEEPYVSLHGELFQRLRGRFSAKGGEIGVFEIVNRILALTLSN